MYSRYHNRPDPSIRIPENYSGCAFSDSHTTPKKSSPPSASSAPPPRRIDVAKPTPPEKGGYENSIAPPLPLLLPPVKKEEPREATKEEPAPPTLSVKHSDPPEPLKKLFGNMGSAFPFSHGLGFDEMLIIGLIILLSRNEEDHDMILWLALLLFCG